MTTRPPAEHAAHRYADAGWPVFPCRPGSKLPATEHGFHDATTSHRQIARWWSAQPEANLAIATGDPGPDVLDVDLKDGRSGYAALAQARRAGLAAHPRAVIRTPSGGAHLYYRGTSQRSGTIPAAALDFRGQGGYVLAPPSLSAETGRPYEVISHQPSDATVDWEAVRRHLTPAREHQPPARPGPGAAERPREVGSPGRMDGRPARRQPQRRPVLGLRPRLRSRRLQRPGRHRPRRPRSRAVRPRDHRHRPLRPPHGRPPFRTSPATRSRLT